MIEVLIITSPNSDEFWHWTQGEHGARIQNNMIYEVVTNNIVIHVVNGKPNNTAMILEAKAKILSDWFLEKKDIASKLCVLIHGQYDNLRKVEECFKDDPVLDGVDWKYYSSQGKGRKIYEIVEKFFQKRNPNNKESVAKELIAALSGEKTPHEKAENANRLRADILSPFVALDLIQQAEAAGSLEDSDNLKKLKKDIFHAMEDIQKPLADFCQPPINCTKFRCGIEKLLRTPRVASSKEDWEGFHDDLDKVAKEMEIQIENIAP